MVRGEGRPVQVATSLRPRIPDRGTEASGPVTNQKAPAVMGSGVAGGGAIGSRMTSPTATFRPRRMPAGSLSPLNRLPSAPGWIVPAMPAMPTI
jgi:hypothetical protein